MLYQCFKHIVNKLYIHRVYYTHLDRMNGELKRINVTIKEKHYKWIKHKHLNFSSWIREKIDEEMKMEGEK